MGKTKGRAVDGSSTVWKSLFESEDKITLDWIITCLAKGKNTRMLTHGFVLPCCLWWKYFMPKKWRNDSNIRGGGVVR